MNHTPPSIHDFKIPAFAKDEEIWEYVMHKHYMAKDGRTPDEYSRGDWMAVNKKYQNAYKKYRLGEGVTPVTSVTDSNMAAAAVAAHTLKVKPCVNCEQMKPHREDDYICVDCREAM